MKDNCGRLIIVYVLLLNEIFDHFDLLFQAPDYGDIRLSVQELPNIIHLEEAFTFTCRIINTWYAYS
jgi:hypothetical protein